MILPFIKELAKTIHYHRKKSGLTQQALAERAGVGKTVIFDLEHGKHTVQLDTVLNVLKVLNIKLNLLTPLEHKLSKRKTLVSFQRIPAGILIEQDNNHYIFDYLKDYDGPDISPALPRSQNRYEFDVLPAFFNEDNAITIKKYL